MECPRCDDTLERYTLGGAEAVVCEGCGYIGVPVEHESEPTEVESWDDAVAAAEGGTTGQTATGDAVPEVGDGDGGAGALCPVCGERFDSQRGVAVHRGQVH